jgi:hypothetical protein
MAQDTGKKLETLEDDQIVTRRQAFGLAAAVLGVGVAVSTTVLAQTNVDTSNATDYDTGPDEVDDEDTATNVDTSNETNFDEATDEDTATNVDTSKETNNDTATDEDSS